MRAAPENIRIPDQFCALATDPSVMRYANSYSQLFGAPLRVTVASIHTGTVLRCVCTYIINAPAGRECILDGVCIIASEVALFLLKLKMQFDTVSGEDDIAIVRRGLLS